MAKRACTTRSAVATSLTSKTSATSGWSGTGLSAGRSVVEEAGTAAGTATVDIAEAATLASGGDARGGGGGGDEDHADKHRGCRSRRSDLPGAAFASADNGRCTAWLRATSPHAGRSITAATTNALARGACRTRRLRMHHTTSSNPLLDAARWRTWLLCSSRRRALDQGEGYE